MLIIIDIKDIIEGLGKTELVFLFLTLLLKTLADILEDFGRLKKSSGRN